MASRGKSETETEEMRSCVLQAKQEIRSTNEVLKQRTRELAQVLAIMRATLDSTTDAILVTDEKNKVIDFNDNYLDMWKIPREVLEGEHHCAMCGSSRAGILLTPEDFSPASQKSLPAHRRVSTF